MSTKKIDKAKEVLRDIFKKKPVKPSDPESKLKELENEINELIGQIISEASPTENNELEAVLHYIADGIKLYPVKIRLLQIGNKYVANIIIGMFLWEKDGYIDLPIMWSSELKNFVQTDTGVGASTDVLVVIAKVIGQKIVELKNKK